MVRENFTLVEVIIGILIIALMTSVAYISFSILTQTTEKIRNREIATDFAQKVLEDIKTQAQTDFDGINHYTIEDISKTFPRFEPPQLRITDINTNLKKIDLTIRWKERKNIPQEYKLTFFLSRPPLPLPANICGRVLDRDTHQSINGIKVYGLNGHKIGKVKEIYLEEKKSKIYGWLIKVDKDISKKIKKKNILVKHKYVESIKHIMIIDKRISEHLEKLDSEVK